MLLETPLQGVLIFFAPRALRLLGALGNAPINSPRTLQHICKPTQANAQSKGFQKSCNFAPAPPSTRKFSLFLNVIELKND
jgi:hypothetical protein